MSISAGAGPPPRTQTQVSELVLAEHTRILQLFGTLDDAPRRSGPAGNRPAVEQVWARLAGLLEYCAAAEEEICFQVLFGRGAHATAMVEDALADHNDIREAAEEARLCQAGSARWWRAVNAARALAIEHFATEEPGLLAEAWDLLEPEAATVLARQWIRFAVTHEGGLADPASLAVFAARSPG